MSENALPKGWVTAGLGQLGVWSGGATPSKENPSFWRNGTIPWISPKDMKVSVIRDAEDRITKAALDSAPLRLLAERAVLLVTRSGILSHTLPVARTDIAVAVNQDIKALTPSPGIDSDFVAQAIRAAGQRILRDCSKNGTTVASVDFAKLLAFSIHLAPVAEQGRVVAAVDSYLSRLDDAQAALERAQRNLKRYRASVLKAAVEGRLVPTEAALARAEKRDYEPASVLLKRILAERRRLGEGKKAKYVEPVAPNTSGLPKLPEGWCWATVDQILVGIEAGKSFRCEERPPERGEVGVVKVSAVTWGVFDENESKTCTRKELVNASLRIRPGDFLLSRANTIDLVGAVVITGEITRHLMLSDKILRLRLLGGLDEWLLWVLRSAHGRREIQTYATGNQDSMRNIGQGGIRQIRIPLPPAHEVDRLVETVRRQMSVASHNEASVGIAQGRITRLRQSILKWAFEGRLVDQDPNDEPASVLLERIARERGAPAKPAGRGGRRRQHLP